MAYNVFKKEQCLIILQIVQKTNLIKNTAVLMTTQKRLYSALFLVVAIVDVIVLNLKQLFLRAQKLMSVLNCEVREIQSVKC